MARGGIRIERFGKDGWFFVSIDDVPGVAAFGPDLKTALLRLRAGAELMLGAAMRRLEQTHLQEADVDPEAGWIPVAAMRRLHETA